MCNDDFQIEALEFTYRSSLGENKVEFDVLRR
jgi:hypothetical protein